MTEVILNDDKLKWYRFWFYIDENFPDKTEEEKNKIAERLLSEDNWGRTSCPIKHLALIDYQY